MKQKVQLFLRPWAIFTLIMLIFGVVFINLIPLGNINDEYNHFIRSAESAEFKYKTMTYREALEKDPNLKMAWVSFATCTEDDSLEKQLDCKGTVLEANIAYAYYGFEGGMLFHPEKPYDWEKFKKDSSWSHYFDPDGKKLFYPARQTSTYAPLAYLPSAMAIWVGMPFNLRISTMAYLMRFFVLLFSIALGALALKLIEKRSRAMSFLLLPTLTVPMLIQQSIAISADAMAYWPVVLALALVYCLDEIRLKQHLTLLLASVLVTVGSIAKPTVAVFALLIFFGARGLTRFGGRPKRYLYSGVLALVPAVAVVIWGKISEVLTIPTYQPFGETSEHWLEMQKTDLNMFISQFMGHLCEFFTYPKYSYGPASYELLIIPGHFGQQDFTLPSWMNICFYILILLLIIGAQLTVRKKENLMPFYLSIPMLLIFTIGSLLAMLIIATPATTPFIDGMQGRYLLIIFPMLLLTRFTKFTPLSADRVPFWLKTFIKAATVITPIAMLIYSVTLIYVRYHYGLA